MRDRLPRRAALTVPLFASSLACPRSVIISSPNDFIDLPFSSFVTGILIIDEVSEPKVARIYCRVRTIAYNNAVK